jgi:hypothetical protein
MILSINIGQKKRLGRDRFFLTAVLATAINLQPMSAELETVVG